MGVSESSNNNKYGFRVYQFYPDSPLIESGIKELEDFILPPKGIDNLNFKDYLVTYSGKVIELIIYNIPSRLFSSITVTIGKNGTLGSLVCYEDYTTAHLNSLKILKVNENSLSSKIGLKKDDFIIAIQPLGEDLISLNSPNCDPLTLFSNIIKTYSNKKIYLFIYNPFQIARKILTNCNSIYNYSLGCEVGYSKGKEIPIKIDNNLNNKFLDNVNFQMKEKNFNLNEEISNNLHSFTFSKSMAESVSLSRKNLENVSSMEEDISPIKSLDNSNNLNIKSISSVSPNSLD